MKALADEIIQFFQNQNFTIITTIGKDGWPHNSCKGIVKIGKDGRVYLLDLYLKQTYENLKCNPRMSITAVDEHKFKGYCLKGKARLIPKEKLGPQVIAAWEDKITSRITQRVIKNMREEKGHPHHPEAFFPPPEYMIVLEAEEIVDLNPRYLK